MHKRGAVLCLALGATLGGLTVAARQPEIQATLFPVEVGYRLTLTYESEHTIACTVNAVSGDFIRCEPDGRQNRAGFSLARPQVENWYNLRTARMITRTIQP
jgi:hypothetical protein